MTETMKDRPHGEAMAGLYRKQSGEAFTMFRGCCGTASQGSGAYSGTTSGLLCPGGKFLSPTMAPHLRGFLFNGGD